VAGVFQRAAGRGHVPCWSWQGAQRSRASPGGARSSVPALCSDRGGAVPAESVRSEGRGWIAVLGDGLASGPALGMQTLAKLQRFPGFVLAHSLRGLFCGSALCTPCFRGSSEQAIHGRRATRTGDAAAGVVAPAVTAESIAGVPGSSFPAACTSGASVASLRTKLFQPAREGRSWPSAPGCPSPVQPGRLDCLWTSANRGRRNWVRPVAPGLALRMVGFAGGAGSGCSEPSV
jgi:hypothetical protein